jgi:hypothetical protein
LSVDHAVIDQVIDLMTKDSHFGKGTPGWAQQALNVDVIRHLLINRRDHTVNKISMHQSLHLNLSLHACLVAINASSGNSMTFPNLQYSSRVDL